MQTASGQEDTRPPQTGRPLALSAQHRNLKLSSVALAELNSRVRNNPSLMQFTTQTSTHVTAGERLNGEDGLNYEPSVKHEKLSASARKWLLHNVTAHRVGRVFTDTTRVTELTGFVYEGDKYICQACAFNSASRIMFREHVRCHTIPMPYSCAQCGDKMFLRNVRCHYVCQHGNCEPSFRVEPSLLVEQIMRKLGPAAPHSVSKISVNQNINKPVPSCSVSSYEAAQPDRPNFSLVDISRENQDLLQALADETNRRHLEMLVANCNYNDGVYVCELCKFSTRIPFQIYEHIISDVQRWNCGCINCLSSNSSNCTVVVAAVHKLMKQEHERDTRDIPTEPIKPIVIAPLGNDAASSEYSASASQSAVVGATSWQSLTSCRYNIADSTGIVFPSINQDVGSPLYLQHTNTKSAASSAHQQTHTTHRWPSAHTQTTPGRSLSSDVTVRNQTQLVPVDSLLPLTRAALNTPLQTTRPVLARQSSFQPAIARPAAPTKPSFWSVRDLLQAPASSTTLPETPTLQQLMMGSSDISGNWQPIENVSREPRGRPGDRDTQVVEGDVMAGPSEARSSRGNNGVIELSDTSDEDQVDESSVPAACVLGGNQRNSLPEKNRHDSETEAAVADNSLGKRTEPVRNIKRNGDRFVKNPSKKSDLKVKLIARQLRIGGRCQGKGAMESDKHVDDSEVAPTDSTEADSDKEEFFRCGVPECKVSYCDVASLKNHMKTYHASMKIYPCPYCSCLWSDHNSLVDHILTHVGPKPYRCVQCDICFVTHSQLKNHLDTSHHVKKLLKCQVGGCEYVSKLWTEFKVHIWNCHPAEDEYTCFACDATFTSPSAYLRHLESGMETLICCAYCPMTSKLRYSIIRHLGSVHQGLRTSVKVQTDVTCGKRNKLTLRKCTPQKQAFKPLVRPVLCQCTLCDFVDADKTLVDVHIENHKSTRDTNLAFSCAFCTFGSNEMQQYAQHLANHRSKVTHQLRYFRCSYCVFTSNQMPLVEKHLEKKHSERPFKFEVQQATVTTNRQEANVASNGRQACASAGGQHDEATMQKPHASCDLGSSKHQNNASTGPSVRKRVVVVPRSGNDKKPHVSGDLKDSSKHPRPASTGSSLHKRLLIVLERCSVPKTTTQNKAAPRLRAKRKSTSDDDDDVTRRHAKRGRKPIETGVAKDHSKAVRRSTEIPADDKTHHRDTSLTDKYEVGDREQMFSEEEEDDSYWREMIRKSTSPEEYAAQEVPSVRSTTGRLDRGSIAGTPIPHDGIRPNRKEPQNYSKSGVSVDECDSEGVEPMSEDDDSFWRDVIRKRNSPGEINMTQSKRDDIVEDEKAVEDIFVSEEDEEEDDTFWRNVVRRSKRDQHSESTCDQPTTVGRICRAPVVSRTLEDGSRDRLPRGVGFIGPQPATPGSSSTPSLTIANYNCTLCEFSCNDWQLFDDHVRSSHENMSADTMTGTSIAKTERSSRKRVVATAAGRVAGLAGCSTTDADAIVSCDDNEMRYHCYLCSIDCPNWKTFESHMSGAHSYNVIKSETTTPFQNIVAVPIEKRSPSARKPFACNKCSFVTYFVHLLKKHCNGHTEMQLNQPHASHRTRTSPRKRMRNIKERTKSDEKRNGPLQPDRTTPRRKLGEIEVSAFNSTY